jgi:hypothetical protein
MKPTRQVKEVFESYAPSVRQQLYAIRELILAVARETDGVGALTETLKWGQPSYLTEATKSGSTVRLGPSNSPDADYAVFFHCQTTLVETFRLLHGDTFRYEGNRAILFRADDPIPQKPLRDCITRALTYHLSKRKAR